MARAPRLARGRRRPATAQPERPDQCPAGPRVRAAPRAEGGFTLVELLVTLAVTVIGMAGLFGVFTATTRGNASARESSEALGLCQGAADEIKSFTVAEMEAMAAYGVIDATGWGPRPYHEGPVVGATGATFVRDVWARALDQDLVWVKVTVSWASEGATLGAEGGLHDHALALEMLRSRGEAPP